MKRSRDLTLTLMAAGAALTACTDGGVTHAVAESADECRLQDFADGEACDRAFNAAYFAHARSAPLFQRRDACQEQFGQCTPVSDAADQVRWRPVMAGYLMRYAPAYVDGVDCNADRRNQACRAHAGGTGAGRTVVASEPLYREPRTGVYFTATNAAVGTRSALLRGGPIDRGGPINARNVPRGGFGKHGLFGG